MGAKNGALVVVFAWAFLALKPFAQMVDIMDSKPSTLVSIGDIGATIDDPRGSVRFTWTYTGEKDEDLFIIVNIVKQHVGYKPFPGTNGTFHRIPTTTDFIIFENIVYGGPGYVARFSSSRKLVRTLCRSSLYAPVSQLRPRRGHCLFRLEEPGWVFGTRETISRKRAASCSRSQ